MPPSDYAANTHVLDAQGTDELDSLASVTDPPDYQSEEELQAHYGPEGPVVAANEWLELVYAGDVKSAWPKTDPNFRLVLVQAWLWANRNDADIKHLDLDEAATSLSDLTFSHDLWDDFEETWVDEIQTMWPDFNHTDWGASSRPRPVGLDYEILVYVKTGGEVMVVEEMTLVENAIVLLMHRTPDWWLIANVGDQLPQPGWPPTSSPPID